MESFQKGNFHDAAQDLMEILKRNPDNFDALHMIGVIYGIKNNHNQALYYLGKAAKLNPKNNFVNFNYAKALSESGQDFEAIKYHQEAVKLCENHAEAWVNFGKSLSNLGKKKDALIHYDRAIKLKPEYAEAWNNKGVTLNELKLYKDALVNYERAIRLNPEYVGAWNNKGVTLNELKLYEDALKHYDRALQLNPEYVEALVNKGITLNELKLYEDALKHYDRALQLNPEYVEALVNKGITLNELKLYEDALKHYDRALQLNPEYVEAWLNKGVTLNELKLNEDALKHYDRALQLRPEYAEAEYYSGLTSLFLKQFNVGWRKYESRLKNKNFINFEFPIDINFVPIWKGEVTCQHLLIISEQGLGDEIFYSYFLKYLISRVEKITVVTDMRLIPIFSRSFPEIKFIKKGEALDIDLYDYQIAIASLPKILEFESLLSKSSRQPFLIDNNELTEKIKKSEMFYEKQSCGISWRSSNKKIGLSKSISLSDLKNVFEIPNAKFINLQYGDVAGELQEFGSLSGAKINSVIDVDVFSNIDGLLSIIKACDWVITTSNVTAHLAGAIGKKTFLLLPYSKGRIWYWHDERVSTWYPCINQYYQDQNLSWSSAIQEISKRLGDEIARKKLI